MRPAAEAQRYPRRSAGERKTSAAARCRRLSDVDAGGQLDNVCQRRTGGCGQISLAAMLFSIAYISGAMAFTGRHLHSWSGVGWRTTLSPTRHCSCATALVLCVSLTVPPWVMFRRMSALSTNGFLLAIDLFAIPAGFLDFLSPLVPTQDKYALLGRDILLSFSPELSSLYPPRSRSEIVELSRQDIRLAVRERWDRTTSKLPTRNRRSAKNPGGYQ